MKKQDNAAAILAISLGLVLLFSLGWGFGHMGGMMFFGPVFMVAILVLAVWAIASLTQGR